MQRIRVGSTKFNLETQEHQRELKECFHSQNTKQITIINLFNELSTVTSDASLGLQFVDPTLILSIMETYITNGRCCMYVYQELHENPCTVDAVLLDDKINRLCIYLSI